MRAVVVYESMYGNTHRVADAIAAGLQDSFEVTVVPVAEAGPAVLADAGLVVVGGPTHAHGMSRAATEPDAMGPGLREWFDSLGQITKQNVLDPGETTRARDWATKLAASIAPG